MAGMCFTLLCVLVTFVVLPTARASDISTVLYQRNVAMNGLRPNITALFQASAPSPIDCGLQCSQMDGCRSYTYIADQLSSCRGYDVTMTSQNANDAEPAARAESFEVVVAVSAWLESTCSATSECPVAASECFKGKCLCTPGYYYSTGSRTCLTDCSSEDLGDVYVKYEESFLLATILIQYYSTSLSHCQNLCVHNNNNCLSFNFASWEYCGLYIYTARTVPSEDYDRHYAIYDHYQRTCA